MQQTHLLLRVRESRNQGIRYSIEKSDSNPREDETDKEKRKGRRCGLYDIGDDLLVVRQLTTGQAILAKSRLLAKCFQSRRPKNTQNLSNLQSHQTHPAYSEPVYNGNVDDGGSEETAERCDKQQ